MIEIKCRGADTLPLDAIEDFQGGLKNRTGDDIAKIIKSIETYGFSFPFFVWNGSGHNYCIDGHGRIQALSEMRKRGEDLPLFPVVYIDAVDEEEAKNKLLRLNSQYGQMTVDSVMEFAGDISVEWGELKLPKDELNIGVYDVDGIELPFLQDGDREPYQQMAFILHDSQVEDIKRVLSVAKGEGFGRSDINENSNGNALHAVCLSYEQS